MISLSGWVQTQRELGRPRRVNYINYIIIMGVSNSTTPVTLIWNIIYLRDKPKTGKLNFSSANVCPVD